MSINITINGKLHKINLRDYPPDITLNTYIRNYAQLSGTKFMCLEGGCGACIVTIRGRHPITKAYHGWAANSCLTLLNICDSWDIITIEGIGNKKNGYHPIQERLAHLNGTQCGYCTPGMIMNMNSLLEANGGKLTMEEIENSFGGNICRCTGYRPILDAMKSFATDTEYEYLDNNCHLNDIEDLGKIKICSLNITNNLCKKLCENKQKTILYDNGHVWYYPENLHAVFNSLQDLGNLEYYLVCGNTGHGVYRRSDNIRAFIDLNYVQELHLNVIGDHLEIGATITLTEIMNILQQASEHNGFEYCLKIIDHIDKIANIPVRNMGTIAGNLMLKYYHNEFPSDIFLLLTSVDANIIVATSPDNFVSMTTTEFLNFDMHKCIIFKIILPKIEKNGTYFETYKITPRAQNAHAFVNAAFLIRMAYDKVITSNLCFGGINPKFIKAYKTSLFLKGKNPFNNEIMKKSLIILNDELKPDWILPDKSPEFRKLLSCGLYYKFILKYTSKLQIRKTYQSGGYLIERPLSNGIQVYDTKPENWPLTKPITKLDALQQCSGEAFYMNDLSNLPKQLWAAFVHATETNFIVVKIDPTEALKMNGVKGFFSAKDIPGKNSYVTIGLFGILEDEEIFCSGIVKYHSQPVGLIVAETNDLAVLAAKKVKILYEQKSKNNEKSIFSIKDALEANIKERFIEGPSTSSSDNYDNSNKKSNLNLQQSVDIIKGHFETGGQYHFSMETHTCVCIPQERGIKLYSSNHFPDLIHTAVANALNLKENEIDFEILRLGGSYGGKLSRSGHVATACSLASIKLNRPIRFVQRLESNMATVGKRNSCICDYNVNVNKKGQILNFNIKYYEDFGCSQNDNPMIFTTPFLSNCYKNDGWIISGQGVITDAPSHTWCRAPGSLEGIAMIENIMEHISRVVKRDPIDVRYDNIPDDSKMKKIIPEFLKTTLYRERKKQINEFNKENRWRKKGIAISLMKYPINYFGSFPATVAIYHRDGTVSITHGGIDMGQGLNTKVTQVAAYTLNIPIEMVTVKATNSINGANTFVTGGSLGSESVCYAVKHACEKLLLRMKSAREQLKNPTWIEITQKCYELNISLIATHLYKMGDLKGYDIWGACCTEIECDVLTGLCQVNRVDLLEDTGESLSPLIDVGQCEGAFIMGLGLWLHEELIYNRINGELLTNRTWNYKVPGCKDIPVDFRVTLLQNSSNSGGFLRSKTTGEPAICLAISVAFALRHAIDSARLDAGIKDDEWYELGAPITVDRVLLACGHNINNFDF